ncbi:hypothetical protein DFJ43DRAFT_815999 [Lentinula guzmanii]|uniref:Protein kinase domain-containing protein n=1 Tax=Lentinula guzmanii TaxID=2804957 RepID=A0AA38JRB1_9AGAR|nr:hypothetical protein DFJ43DRAFT_815999 [Lentinula guzmanii]
MRHFIFLCISLLTLSPSFVFGNTSDDVAKLQGIKAQEMSKTVTPQDRTTYFSHDISGRLSQAKKLPGAKGKYTKAIYTWTEDGTSVIMKVLSLKASRDEVIGEAKALSKLNDLRGTGRVNMRSIIHNKMFPAIIMSKKTGESYFSSQAYKQTHKKARGALLQSVKEKVCEEVARVASTTGILHYDNQPDNILITFSKDGSNVLSVQLIDYGPPYTYAVDTSVMTDIPIG